MNPNIDSRENVEKGNAAFVIPFWSEGKPIRLKYLKETLDSIYEQTDPNWKIYITDDCSSSEEANGYLRKLEADSPEKIKVYFSETNNGCGHARVQSMESVLADNCPFVCWLDSDDITSKYRVEEVRRIFLEDPEAAVVYSTFQAIDEDSNIVPKEKLTPSLQEIIEANEEEPLQGMDVWIPIATETGYINIPSATSVKTSLAERFPFPRVPFCEDLIAWFKYSASGGKFVYSAKIPILYRVPQSGSGSESRERAGGKTGFYEAKCRLDTEGIDAAIELACARGVIDEAKGKEVKVKFLVRLAETVGKEEQYQLAKKQIQDARTIHAGVTDSFLKKRSLTDQSWAQ